MREKFNDSLYSFVYPVTFIIKSAITTFSNSYEQQSISEVLLKMFHIFVPAVFHSSPSRCHKAVQVIPIRPYSLRDYPLIGNKVAVYTNGSELADHSMWFHVITVSPSANNITGSYHFVVYFFSYPLIISTLF